MTYNVFSGTLNPTQSIRYKTLHLLRNLLFVDMFGMLSLLTLFILDAVY